MCQVYTEWYFKLEVFEIFERHLLHSQFLANEERKAKSKNVTQCSCNVSDRSENKYYIEGQTLGPQGLL